MIAACAVLLGVGGFITTKAKAGAKKHLGNATSAYFTPNNGGSWFTVFANGSSQLTTHNTLGKTARIKTAAVGGLYTMRTSPSTGAHPLFY